MGLFVVAGIVATDMLFRFEGFPRFFHGLFINVPVAGTVAVVCLAGGAWQVRRALASLARLRTGSRGSTPVTRPVSPACFPARSSRWSTT